MVIRDTSIVSQSLELLRIQNQQHIVVIWQDLFDDLSNVDTESTLDETQSVLLLFLRSAPKEVIRTTTT